jgi:hypothetical protein
VPSVRARAQLATTQFTLDSGLDRTLAWYREVLGAPAAMSHAGGDKLGDDISSQNCRANSAMKSVQS